jgi:hypothetical protein
MLGLSSLAGQAAENRVFSTELRRVQTICVGEMGQTDEAARFRLLMQEELAKKGFTVVPQPEKADALLTSVVAPGLSGGAPSAPATVELHSLAGERLWGGEYPRRSALFKHAIRDAVRFRAENVARDLRSDWNASVKAARRLDRK